MSNIEQPQITFRKAGESHISKAIGVTNYLMLERLAFQWAEKLIHNYLNGQWSFAQASNGAWFMVPPAGTDSQLVVTSMGYQCDVEASPTAAGIAITMFAINHMLERAANQGLSQHSGIVQSLWQNIELLRDAAYQGALPKSDRTAIYRITD